MIKLSSYSKIKDRYCVCYFGFCNEYIIQLLYLRPRIEAALPGLELYIGCHDRLAPLTDGYEKIVFVSQIEAQKENFAHIRVINYDGSGNHPIQTLLKESSISLPYVRPLQKSSKKCVIYPIGYLPTQPLSPTMLEKVKNHCMQQGYQITIESSMEDVGWVVGVENEYLFKAAFAGIRTSLVPTGIGTQFYQMLCGGEILNI